MRRIFLFFLLPFYTFVIPVLPGNLQGFALAQRGKDGAKTITAPGTIVNEFTPLTANAFTGNTSIAVASSSLNANNRFAGNLAPGDLVLIIQVQGATLRGNVNDSTWGEVLGYNQCGMYEFQQVSSVSGPTAIVIDCPLKNNYSAQGRTQVIRVPRYTSLTVNSGGILTTDPWNGTTGGILVTETLGATTVNTGGTIDVSGLGFRGGALDNNSALPGMDSLASLSPSKGAEKGESIGGYQSDYDAYGGRYGRGAPANGGGGGNAHNSSGGGGGNGGNPAAYTGNGNPDNSNPQWTLAWNLCYPGFANSTSSGGGRGGYTYASNNGDATTDPPGKSTWGGDLCRNVGGKGGRPLDYSGARIFLGGGGGAGDGNDNCASAGGNGGGMVYLISYGTIGGSGMAAANGNPAGNTVGNGNDAVGGGGSGGTLILSAAGAISGISASANGGAGGNQIISTPESEGPGGGGGGGYIAVSNGSITPLMAGGPNGTSNSSLITEFPPNGATAGGTGSTGSVAAPLVLTTVNDTICPGISGTISASATPPSSSIFWYTAPAGGTPFASGATATTPPLTSTTVFYAAVCPGTYRVPDTVFVNPVAAAGFGSPASVCFNNSMQFTDQSSVPVSSWSWNFGDGKTSSLQNPAHTYNNSGTYSVTLAVVTAQGCRDSVTHVITVNPLPTVNFSSPAVCVGNPTCFTNLSTISSGTLTAWSWNFGDPNLAGNISNAQHPCVTYTASGTYTVLLTVTSSSGCQSSAMLPAFVNPPPAASFSVANVCVNTSANFTNTSTGGANQWLWNFGDGSASSLQSPAHTYQAAGTYTVTLAASSGSSCSDTVTQVITVYPLPAVNFSADSVCRGFPTTFHDGSFVPSGSVSGWSWTFGDPASGGNNVSSLQHPAHIFSSAGTFTVTLAVTSATGCSASSSKAVSVFPPPTADFSSQPGSDILLTDPVAFTDLSSGNIIRWLWNLGDGATDTVRNPSHVYSDTGTFHVTLIVVSKYGCADTIERPLTVKDFAFYIPNCFTPNQDKINEFFFGKGIGITHYELSIFDRWGNLIFYCNINDLPQSAPCQWDGTVTGIGTKKVVQEDVYVWKVHLTNIFKKEFNYTGTVTVVK